MNRTARPDLRWLAWLSAGYDALLGLPMLAAPAAVAALFGATAPVPAVNAQLNGVFVLALATGYVWAAADPVARRGYFWVAGVLAKGLGAAVFVIDHVTRESPAAFLAFAATDGALAALTLALLLRRREPGSGPVGHESGRQVRRAWRTGPSRRQRSRPRPPRPSP